MTKITKRLFCIVTVFLLALVFAGCEFGGGSNKERTIAKNSVNQFLSINYGETLGDRCLEPVTGNVEIVNEVAEHPATEYDLANNCYSGFMNGTVSARFESSNPEVMDVKWISSKVRTLTKEGDKITGIAVAEQKKLAFIVTQPEEDTVVYITTYATAPYEINGVTYKYTSSRTLEFTVAAKPQVEAKEMTIAEINAFANADWTSFQTKGIFDETGDKLTVVTHGVVTEELWGDGYDSHSFVMSDGEESFYVYAPTSAVEIGDYVEVTCVPTYYYSIIETSQKAVTKVLYGGAEIPEAKAYTVDSWCAAHPDGSAFHDAPGQRLALTGILDYSTAKGSYVMKSAETGVEMAIYYKSYNSYEEGLIKQYLGMPVVLTTSIYDYHSSGYWRLLPNVYDYPIQPLTMTDEQKVAAVKSQIAATTVAPKYYVGDAFTLPASTNADVTVTWAADPADVLVNGKFAKAANAVTFTATITCGTATDTATLTTKVAEKEVVTVTYAETTEHVEGVAYKFAVVQGNLENKVLYFNGQVSGNYLATTDDAESAADVFVEVVEGGYKLYTLDGETKKYIEAYVSGTYVNLKLAEAGEVVYTYNEEYNTFVCHLLDNDKYIGTYKTFDTLRTSNLSYAATSFVAHLYKAEGGETPDENEAGMKAAMEAGLALAAGANTTEEYTFTGVVTGKVGNSFYLQAGKYGMYVYNKAIEELKVGDLVTVTATLTNYNGLVETKAISAAEIVGTGTLPTPKVIAELADIEQIMSNTLITVDGLTYKSGSITVGSSSGVYFNFGSGELQVRTDKYLEDAVEEAIKAKIESIEAGDTVKLVGIVASWNKGVAQCQFLSADNIIITKGQGGDEPEEPETTYEVTTEHAANTAYKLGLVQANLNKTLFFTGKMDKTYYFGTTEDPEAAVDVYVEVVEGGYKLYFLEGTTKKYIGGKISGTHNNIVFGDAESTTLFVYDETNNTFIVTLGENQLYMGTYGSNNTISLSTLDKMATSYVAHLYKAVGGETPVEPEEPEVTYVTVAAAKAATGEVNVKGLVAAIYARGFVLEDTTGAILVYKNAAVSDLAIGDYVAVKGTVSAYPAGSTAYQLGSPTYEKLTGSAGYTLSTATTWTATEVDAAWAQVVGGTFNFVGPLVKMEVTMSISGTYYNASIEGSTAKLSFSYPIDSVKNALVNGKTYEVTAMAYSYSNSSNVPTYFNFIVLSATEKTAGGGEEEPPVEPVETPTMTIAEVLASQSNITTQFKVSGLVSSIKTAYNSQFNNVTFFITDGTNELQIYRLSGGADIVVGDYVTVKGTYTTSYGGEIEAGCTLEEKAPYMTIANVLASEANITTPIVVSGTVSRISSAYSEQFNNVTFFISDGTNELQIYRLTGGAEIAVGDTVYVKGTYTTSYGGEIEAKCELLMRTPAPEEEPEEGGGQGEGGSETEEGLTKYTIDFVKSFSTYASGWSNSYSSKTLTNSNFGLSNTTFSVTLSNTSKQTGTITTMPTMASKNTDQYVTLNVTNANINEVTFNLVEWSTSKKFQTATLEYTTNGTTWTQISGVGFVNQSTKQSIPTKLSTGTLPEGVIAVRLVFNGGNSSSNQQFGLSSIEVTQTEK